MFARFGLPQVIVTDNGTCFTSSELVQFVVRKKIQHVSISPYHPSRQREYSLNFNSEIKKQLCILYHTN